MSSSVLSLLSLLPPHSFLMGKGVRAPEEVGAAPERACAYCGDGSHSVELAGSPGAEVVFLVESDAFQNSKEEQLLNKIREAMKMQPEQVGILVRSSGSSLDDWSPCVPFQWKELKRRAPKVLIALGDRIGSSILGSQETISGLRGRIHNRFDLNVLVTEELSGMIENPNLKKQAWEDLKLALKVVKA
jgi:DNA polymerase